jgi:hypothetical protein
MDYEDLLVKAASPEIAHDPTMRLLYVSAFAVA